MLLSINLTSAVSTLLNKYCLRHPLHNPEADIIMFGLQRKGEATVCHVTSDRRNVSPLFGPLSDNARKMLIPNLFSLSLTNINFLRLLFDLSVSEDRIIQ